MDILGLLSPPSLLLLLKVLWIVIESHIYKSDVFLGFTSLSEELREVRSPIPWQNSKIDWDTLAGASVRTSPTSSILRMLVLVVLACWYMVSVVWRKEDWSPTISRVSHTISDINFSDMSVRFMKDSTKQQRFLTILLPKCILTSRFLKIYRAVLWIYFWC